MRRGEVPLAQDERKAVKSGEDESVAEATEQRQESDDGLSQQKLIGSPHQSQDVFAVETLPEVAPDLSRAIDVRLLAGLAAALGFAVEEDSGASFRDDDQMGELNDSTEDKLGVEDPAPVGILRHEATDDWCDDGAGAGGEDNIEHGELLILGAEHVGDHAKCNTAACGGETSHDTTSKDGSKACRQHARELKEIDETERYLHNPFATEFLRERSPEFTTETVSDEKSHLTETSLERGDAKFLGHARNSVGVDCRVVVHADLNPEDDSEDPPFFRRREGKPERRLRDRVLASKFRAGVPAFFDNRARSLLDRGVAALRFDVGHCGCVAIDSFLEIFGNVESVILDSRFCWKLNCGVGEEVGKVLGRVASLI